MTSSKTITAFEIDGEVLKSVLTDGEGGSDTTPLAEHARADYARASDRHKPASITDEDSSVAHDVDELVPPEPVSDDAEITSQRRRVLEKYGRETGGS